ncbi:efflux RND transporter permease subunit [candidate division KSB1 bacterium]|nr:efflux RND transporter permease subunit [candidate division KSB1 bacterium]
MNPAKISVENHHFTIIAVLLLIIFGLFAIFNMPKSENPAIEPPGTSIIVLYPGATPEDMEELVTIPIEEEINTISEINEMTSTSGNGFSNIVVDFDFGVDIDEKYTNITEKINNIQNELPRDITSIDIIKHEISNVFILELALVSETAEYKNIEKKLEQLKFEIEKINGIRGVEIKACPEQQVRVSIDLEKMARLSIPLERVIGLIQSTNSNIPGGSIDIGGKNFNINTSGFYESLDDIKNTIIPVGAGQIVYLRDIATVNYDYQDINYFTRFNGKRAVLLVANQKEGTNLFQITKNIKQTIQDFEQDLPEDMSIHYAFNQTESVSDFIFSFLLNLLEGILLVGLIVWFGIGNRPAVIVMLSIPISICIAMGFMNLNGYGIQQMTIAGLVIVLGILVDNAIVVTQNVNRFLLEGHDPKSASIGGTTQIAAAIASGTITTCIAFMPILLMKDIAGEYIRSMPLIVIYTLLASLFLALTFTPYLCSVSLKKESANRVSLLQKLLQNIIETIYRRTLKKVLKKPGRILVISSVIFLASLGLIPMIGVSMFPKSDKPMFFIDISTPDGTNLQKTDKTVKLIENSLLHKNYVKHFVSNIGGDNPRIYYNVIPQQSKPHVAQVFVQLKKNYSNDIPKIIKELMDEYASLPGAKVKIKQLEQAYPNEAPIAMKIIGKDTQKIKELSRDVEKIFKNTAGLVNIENPLDSDITDLKVTINREKVAMLGLTLADVDKTIRICLAGMSVSTFRNPEGDQFDIVVRLPVHESPRMTDFDKIYITSVTGAQIPLKQVASIEFDSGPQNIHHYMLERSNSVLADVMQGYSVDKQTKEIIKKLETYDWPAGYYFRVSGEKESQGKAFGGLGNNFIIALIGIFAVLVFQFKSFRQPFIIFSSIPLAVIGSILALLASGYTFSFTAMIGLTSLAGIVINNAIILVDYANELRKNGLDLVSAVQISGETRFMPIVLTAATTIFGLLPLTLFGGSMWGPMGWAIIGGLSTSTFLTLIVVPALYKVFTKVD